MGEGTVFGLFVSSHLDGGGGEDGGNLVLPMEGVTPIPGQDGEYPHLKSGRDVLHLRSEWGTPISRMGVPPSAELGYPPGLRSGRSGTPNWNSIVSTSYAAGGVPLAFMQEDFLVDKMFTGG